MTTRINFRALKPASTTTTLPTSVPSTASKLPAQTSDSSISVESDQNTCTRILHALEALFADIAHALDQWTQSGASKQGYEHEFVSVQVLADGLLINKEFKLPNGVAAKDAKEVIATLKEYRAKRNDTVEGPTVATRLCVCIEKFAHLVDKLALNWRRKIAYVYADACKRINRAPTVDFQLGDATVDPSIENADDAHPTLRVKTNGTISAPVDAEAVSVVHSNVRSKNTIGTVSTVKTTRTDASAHKSKHTGKVNGTNIAKSPVNIIVKSVDSVADNGKVSTINQVPVPNSATVSDMSAKKTQTPTAKSHPSKSTQSHGRSSSKSTPSKVVPTPRVQRQSTSTTISIPGAAVVTKQGLSANAWPSIPLIGDTAISYVADLGISSTASTRFAQLHTAQVTAWTESLVADAVTGTVTVQDALSFVTNSIAMPVPQFTAHLLGGGEGAGGSIAVFPASAVPVESDDDFVPDSADQFAGKAVDEIGVQVEAKLANLDAQIDAHFNTLGTLESSIAFYELQQTARTSTPDAVGAPISNTPKVTVADAATTKVSADYIDSLNAHPTERTLTSETTSQDPPVEINGTANVQMKGVGCGCGQFGTNSVTSGAPFVSGPTGIDWNVYTPPPRAHSHPHPSFKFVNGTSPNSQPDDASSAASLSSSETQSIPATQPFTGYVPAQTNIPQLKLPANALNARDDAFAGVGVGSGGAPQFLDVVADCAPIYISGPAGRAGNALLNSTIYLQPEWVQITLVSTAVRTSRKATVTGNKQAIVPVEVDLLSLTDDAFAAIVAQPTAWRIVVRVNVSLISYVGAGGAGGTSQVLSCDDLKALVSANFVKYAAQRKSVASAKTPSRAIRQTTEDTISAPDTDILSTATQFVESEFAASFENILLAADGTQPGELSFLFVVPTTPIQATISLEQLLSATTEDLITTFISSYTTDTNEIQVLSTADLTTTEGQQFAAQLISALSDDQAVQSQLQSLAQLFVRAQLEIDSTDLISELTQELISAIESVSTVVTIAGLKIVNPFAAVLQDTSAAASFLAADVQTYATQLPTIFAAWCVFISDVMFALYGTITGLTAAAAASAVSASNKIITNGILSKLSAAVVDALANTTPGVTTAVQNLTGMTNFGLHHSRATGFAMSSQGIHLVTGPTTPLQSSSLQNVFDANGYGFAFAENAEVSKLLISADPQLSATANPYGSSGEYALSALAHDPHNKKHYIVNATAASTCSYPCVKVPPTSVAAEADAPHGQIVQFLTASNSDVYAAEKGLLGTLHHARAARKDFANAGPYINDRPTQYAVQFDPLFVQSEFGLESSYDFAKLKNAEVLVNWLPSILPYQQYVPPAAGKVTTDLRTVSYTNTIAPDNTFTFGTDNLLLSAPDPGFGSIFFAGIQFAPIAAGKMHPHVHRDDADSAFETSGMPYYINQLESSFANFASAAVELVLSEVLFDLALSFAPSTVTSGSDASTFMDRLLSYILLPNGASLLDELPANIGKPIGTTSPVKLFDVRTATRLHELRRLSRPALRSATAPRDSLVRQRAATIEPKHLTPIHPPRLVGTQFTARLVNAQIARADPENVWVQGNIGSCIALDNMIPFAGAGGSAGSLDVDGAVHNSQPGNQGMLAFDWDVTEVLSATAQELIDLISV